MAVVSAESSFNPNAISNDGHESKGLMQLLDSTGRAQLNLAEVSQEYDPFHPPLNVDLGVQYLRQLHDMFGTQTSITNQLSTIPAANSSSLEKLAVAAYNAGQGRVASAQQRAARAGNDAAEYSVVEPYLPQSTQEYVKRVMQRRETYEARFGVLANESTT
jgi:soluble lytic murein transglycosylase-like protein